MNRDVATLFSLRACSQVITVSMIKLLLPCASILAVPQLQRFLRKSSSRGQLYHLNLACFTKF